MTTDYWLQQNRRTFTNLQKAGWTQFREDTESAFTQTTIPTNIHTANIFFTNIILKADKPNIPTGKMHNKCSFLPDHIVCKTKQRNNIQRANTCDPALKLLNEEITSDIQKHIQNLWKEYLDAHWDHRHNMHIIWKTIHGISKRPPPPTLKHIHNIQQQNSNHTQSYCELFNQTIPKHCQIRNNKTNRYTIRETHKIQGYNIPLTTTHVHEAIKQCKHNNSQGADNKHIIYTTCVWEHRYLINYMNGFLWLGLLEVPQSLPGLKFLNS